MPTDSENTSQPTPSESRWKKFKNAVKRVAITENDTRVPSLSEGVYDPGLRDEVLRSRLKIADKENIAHATYKEVITEREFEVFVQPLIPTAKSSLWERAIEDKEYITDTVLATIFKDDKDAYTLAWAFAAPRHDDVVLAARELFGIDSQQIGWVQLDVDDKPLIKVFTSSAEDAEHMAEYLDRSLPKKRQVDFLLADFREGRVHAEKKYFSGTRDAYKAYKIRRELARASERKTE